MTQTSKVIQGKLPCPVCPSSDAYHLYDDGHGYCYSCKYLYLPNWKEDSLDETYTYEYVPLRGLSREALQHYSIKSKCDATGKPVSIGFPYPNGSHKVRSLDRKEFKWVGESQPSLFGFDRFAAGAHKSCIITEGELDAASFFQVVRLPCYSVRSSGSAVSDVSSVRSELNSYERIYLAFDNDPRGAEATAAVAKLFDYSKVYHIRFSNRKDANEYLQAGEGDELLNLYHNAKPYLPSTIISSFDDFKSVLSKPKQVGVPYPFPTLTKMTYGIRTGETVLFKAPEKVGKTALMHAIEHQLLKETDSNVGAIYIEEPQQRHLQAIAGIELKKPVHLPDCDCSADEVFAAIRKAVKKDDRLHIYNHFGTSDPDVVLDTIRFLVVARECRYIIFDHITMAVTGLAGERDERRALEYLASRLEMLVKELNFALIMVSHVNDFGQTRGSHYLTKVADIVVDATRDPLSNDGRLRRTIHLTVPYNRFCASTGPAGNIEFDLDTYTLTERDDDGHSNLPRTVHSYSSPVE